MCEHHFILSLDRLRVRRLILPDMSGASVLNGEITINLGSSDRRKRGDGVVCVCARRPG
jgi:hypothetical protein